MEPGTHPAAERPKDYSLFAEEYRKNLKRIADLKDRIAQREKFAVMEASAGRQDVAAKMRAEIAVLTEEIEAADLEAKADLEQHRHTTQFLEKLDPDQMPRA